MSAVRFVERGLLKFVCIGMGATRLIYKKQLYNQFGTGQPKI